MNWISLKRLAALIMALALAMPCMALSEGGEPSPADRVDPPVGEIEAFALGDGDLQISALSPEEAVSEAIEGENIRFINEDDDDYDDDDDNRDDFDYDYDYDYNYEDEDEDEDEDSHEPEELTVYISKNTKVTCNLDDTLAIYVEGYSVVSWSSSSKSRATVEFDGECAYVTTHKEGQVTLTAKLSNKKKLKVTLKIEDPYKPTDVEFTQDQYVFKVGDTYELLSDVVLSPSYARTEYKWSSSNTNVAKVSSDGTLTARKAGKATINVRTKNGKTARMKVKVLANEVEDLFRKPVKNDLSLIGNGWTLFPYSLEEKSDGRLECELHFLNGTDESSRYIRNLDLALAVGSADNIVAEWVFDSIKVSCSRRKYKKIKVTFPPEAVQDSSVFFPEYGAAGIFFCIGDDEPVLQGKEALHEYVPTLIGRNIPVEEIYLNTEEATLKKGNTLTLKTKVLPTDASNRKLIWSSSDNTVASVSSSGKVTARGEGIAIITAEAADGSGASAECEITVPGDQILVKKIEITGSETLAVGDTSVIFVFVEPENATNPDVVVSSSNPSVAKVEENNIITALKKGTAIITARAMDGSGKSASYVVKVDMERPEPPKVTDITAHSIALKWNAVASAKSYTIAYGPSDEYDYPYEGCKELKTTKTSCTLTGLLANTEYTFCLIAEGSSISPSSNVNTAKTLSEAKAKTAVALNKSSAKLDINKWIRLTATVTPAAAASKGVRWSSSKPEVASVSSKGIVLGISVGKATITATAADGSGAKASCTITVNPDATAVSAITLNKSSMLLKPKASGTLKATVTPASATNKKVLWRTSNKAVAVVDENGVVTAKAKGRATITAEAADGSGAKAECLIIVNP